MKHFIFFIAFLPLIALKAQQPMPGGVSGASLWKITENNPSEQAQWKSKIKSNPDSGLLVTGKSKVINNNPGLYFNAETIDNTLDLGKLATFSLFTVCQETDTLLEKIIVSLENDTAPEMVFTNQRMAALDLYCYSNFNKNKNLVPTIYAYAQNKSKDATQISHRLQLGRPPRNQNLPVSFYKGVIPEIILFNRYLSPRERQKVESYLALKYGISLNQEFPVSYFNSEGEIIWNAELHTTYNQNIAGIGKDDVSGLYQKVSESTQTPGVMKIALHNELKNNSFIIWGDNGRPLRFSDQMGIRPLLREWKITTFHTQNDSIYSETNVLALNEINPLREKETYWMMIDRSGTGNYPFKQTEYIQCQPMTSARGIIFFRQFAVDPDRSGSDIFTLLAAPAFFSRSIIIQPTCATLKEGMVQTEITGGTPPYILTLKNVSNPMSQQSTKEISKYHTFEDLSQGAYILSITDANHNTCNEKLWVSNHQPWETEISRDYKLTEGEALTLDASKGMPAVNYTYTWTFPDGTILNNESIHITQPGNYLLSVTDEFLCNSTIEIAVNQTGKANFKYLELFPNPTSGWFAIRVNLKHNANVKLTITDLSGKIIKQTLLQNDSYYWYNDQILQQGIYFIILTTGNEKETLKLVVQ